MQPVAADEGVGNTNGTAFSVKNVVVQRYGNRQNKPFVKKEFESPVSVLDGFNQKKGLFLVRGFPRAEARSILFSVLPIYSLSRRIRIPPYLVFPSRFLPPEPTDNHGGGRKWNNIGLSLRLCGKSQEVWPPTSPLFSPLGMEKGKT